ncbi:MAG: type I-C CRISPR-associated protein Cas8c/Csd1 [Pseudomonadota bacterium]
MTILQELAALYDARAEEKGWPKPGFSTEKIGAVVVLVGDGSVREIRRLGSYDKNKFVPQILKVPAAIKRASGIRPNILWDKTAYVLGVTETPDGPGQGKRTEAEHMAFKAAHLELLEEADDPALTALRIFCETWTPERFADHPDAASLVDQNVVFRLGDGDFVHNLPAAQTLLKGTGEGAAVCLVSGRAGPVARLHPSIKGVMGAQTAGASLVSFNDAAYESHGKKQGDNAPVSEAAAFAYGTALNALLAKGSGNHLRIGGDTVAFWAEDGGAEDAFRAMFAGSDPEAEAELRDRLQAVAEGRVRTDDDLDPAARLFILGLAPNAARLAVRYWHPGTLGDFAKAVTQFWADMAIAPSPFVKGGVDLPPKPWALLYDLAAQRDAGNIPAGLGGDLMRAILTGGRYPATWLSAVMGRIRVEGEPDRARNGNVDGRRAAMIAAVLRRNYEREVPMALDETARDAAYLLGRLFGAYAYAEKSYQERGAGLRQKYLGAASATPARVFPVLMRGYEHNLSSLRKAGGAKTGAGVKADRAVVAIMDGLDGEMPATLPLEAQGRFFIGFYHQTSAFYAKAEDAVEALIDTENEGEDA